MFGRGGWGHTVQFAQKWSTNDDSDEEVRFPVQMDKQIDHAFGCDDSEMAWGQVVRAVSVLCVGSLCIQH